MINVKCACGRVIRAKDELAGKTVKCPECESPLRLPLILAEATAPARVNRFDAWVKRTPQTKVFMAAATAVWLMACAGCMLLGIIWAYAEAKQIVDGMYILTGYDLPVPASRVVARGIVDGLIFAVYPTIAYAVVMTVLAVARYVSTPD